MSFKETIAHCTHKPTCADADVHAALLKVGVLGAQTSNLVAQMRAAAAEQEKHYSLLEDGADWIKRASALLPLIPRETGTELAREVSTLLSEQSPQPKPDETHTPTNSKSLWVWFDPYYGLRAATVKPAGPSAVAVEYAPVSSPSETPDKPVAWRYLADSAYEQSPRWVYFEENTATVRLVAEGRTLEPLYSRGSPEEPFGKPPGDMRD